mmetsp:Transcript_28404/g.92766  ORF Transcript_28404/g.92766 Transcript_28404/m.92766 type:complete len:314 (-) Transcript_28404:1311-2252(-)
MDLDEELEELCEIDWKLRAPVRDERFAREPEREHRVCGVHARARRVRQRISRSERPPVRLSPPPRPRERHRPQVPRLRERSLLLLELLERQPSARREPRKLVPNPFVEPLSGQVFLHEHAPRAQLEVRLRHHHSVPPPVREEVAPHELQVLRLPNVIKLRLKTPLHLIQREDVLRLRELAESADRAEVVPKHSFHPRSHHFHCHLCTVRAQSRSVHLPNRSAPERLRFPLRKHLFQRSTQLALHNRACARRREVYRRRIHSLLRPSQVLRRQDVWSCAANLRVLQIIPFQIVRQIPHEWRPAIVQYLKRCINF